MEPGQDNWSDSRRTLGYAGEWIAMRLQEAVNTYYRLYLNEAVTFDPNTPENNKLNTTALFNTIRDSGSWTVNWMKGAAYEPAYRLNIGWIVMDFISCSILVTAAVLGAWLRRQILAPDIFGYVSSITRENPHVPLPDGGSRLSGMERARKMKNVKIRIADLAHDAEVGRVGVALHNQETGHAVMLQKSKVNL